MNANNKSSKQTKLPASKGKTTFAENVINKKNSPTKILDDTKPLLDSILFGMEEVKAHEIMLMDLRKIGNASTDYYIVCHGNTGTQVKAISESVEKETIKHVDERPLHIEGTQNAKWILMDYGNIVVHIFDKEAREFYALEELWGDADTTNISV